MSPFAVHKPQRKGTFSLQRKELLLIALYIGLSLILGLTFPKDHYSQYSYKVNDITRQTIIAPFDFPILKSQEELKHDRDEALRKVPFVFVQDTEVPRTAITRLSEFFTQLENLRALRTKMVDSRTMVRRYRYSKKYEEVLDIYTSDSLAFTTAKKTFTGDFKFNIESSLFNTLLNHSNADQNPLHTESLQPKIQKILSSLFDRLVLDIPLENIISEQISIKQNGEELLEDPAELLTLEEAWTEAKLMLQSEYPEQGSEVINVGYEIIIHFLKPNLIHQREITEARQKEAIDKVPISRGIVLENEKIVDANTKVTPEIHRKLDSLSKERARRTNTRSRFRRSLPIIGDPVMFVGQTALVGIILGFFIVFLLAYRPQYAKDRKMVILFGIIFIFHALLASLFVSRFHLSPYAIPITIAAMTLTILFDSRIAFVGSATLSILIGAQLGGDVNFIITSVLVAAFAISSVRRLRRRSQIFLSIIYIGVGYILAISITALLQFASMGTVLNHILFASINAIISPFLSYGIIGLFEMTFGITTDLTLLELADFNHPLLRLLGREATGTFTHCVTVGNLAEAGAEAIGANSLLARVGAYYHDIGKIMKPEYFVENQSYDENRHDKLAPNLSALIIINHIKEGLRLANEYKLPQAVKDFIPTHHGTTRVEYFYNRAQELAEESGAEINESDFRYPGPKPFTKETALLMICESIEAATRSLDKPSLASIERIVDQIIEKRLSEGQLAESPLTFDDLRKIKGDIKGNYGIMPILKGIFHLRVEYPGQNPAKAPKQTTTETAKKKK